MKLKAGQSAPDFSLPDQDGVTRCLSDFRGKKVILFFYPKDNTPTCTNEACNFRDNFSLLARLGYVVFGISADSGKSHQRFIQKYGLPYSLLSDPDFRVIRKYGAWGRKLLFGRSFLGIRRITFVIDETGMIARIIEKVKSKESVGQILDRG